MVPAVPCRPGAHTLGASAENRTPLPGLAIQRSANEPHPLFTSSQVVKELVGDPGFEPGVSCFQGKRVRPFPKSPKN